MPKFRAYGVVVGSKYLGTFEAPNEEAAREIAWGHAYASLCYQCSDECEDPEIDKINIEPVEEPASTE